MECKGFGDSCGILLGGQMGPHYEKGSSSDLVTGSLEEREDVWRELVEVWGDVLSSLYPSAGYLVPE